MQEISQSQSNQNSRPPQSTKETKQLKNFTRNICFLFILLSLNFLLVYLNVSREDLKRQNKYLNKSYKNLDYQKTVVNYESLVPQFKVVRIWLGDGDMGAQYKHHIDSLPYPHVILGNEDWETLAVDYHKYDLQVDQKTDILRLLYLYENSGIYVDFEAFVDYSCLIDLLKDRKGFWIAGGQENSSYPFSSSLFEYASENKLQQIKKTLEYVQNSFEKTTTKQLHDQTNIVPEPKKVANTEIHRCVAHPGSSS